MSTATPWRSHAPSAAAPHRTVPGGRRPASWRPGAWRLEQINIAPAVAPLLTLLLSGLAGPLAACPASPSDHDPAPAQTCEEPLEQAVDAARADAGLAAPSPAWAPPARSAERSLPGVEGVALDPSPLGRGAHPVERCWRDPSTCKVVGGAYAGPLPGPWSAPPDERPLPAGSWPAPRGAGSPLETTAPAGTWPRALLVTADDPGAAADAAAWTRALAALGARGRVLHRPGRAAFEDAVAALCGGLTGTEAVVLVAAGPADPGGAVGEDASGAPPALLLGPGAQELGEAPQDEAISFPRLAALLGAQCDGAGLLVLVLDTSYAGAVARALPPRPPALVWTAADGDAPRLDVGAGGLLTAALAPLVEARAQAACLASTSQAGAAAGTDVALAPSVGDVARAFREDGVVAAMRAARWARFGAPALDLSASPREGAALRARVLADVPRAPLSVRGDVPTASRCEEPEDCAVLDAACPAGGLGPAGADGACLRWTCRAGACEVEDTPGAPCDDANPCTVDDHCGVGGGCDGHVDACDDGDPCTADVCLADEGCVHGPATAGRACDDGDACTVDDACDGAGSCVGAARDCDDGDPCTLDDCDPASGCVNHTQNVACDDGDPCTVLDFCGYGVCRGQPKGCDDGDPCTADACDPDTGACLDTPRPAGAPCDDEDPCTVGDACVGGACVGQALACDDGLACTYDACEGGVCHHLPAPGSCLGEGGCVPVGAHPPESPCLVCASTNTLVPDDGAACPDDGVACTGDVCVQGTCEHLNAPDTCTTEAGGCVGLGDLVAPCARCVGTGVASPEAPGTPCDDGDPCTTADACGVGGQCAGELEPCCPVAEELTCQAEALGDTSSPGAPSVQLAWSCLSGAVFDGPEAAHAFTAPCDGSYTFRLQPDGTSGEPLGEGPDGRVLLFVRGAPESCQQDSCEAYAQLGAPQGLTRQLAAGEEATLVVDGLNGAAGAYRISVNCPCEVGP